VRLAIEIGVGKHVAHLVAASLSSSSPPSTDCSASSECGGSFNASSCGSSGIVTLDGGMVEDSGNRSLDRGEFLILAV
jgi:hypothetical protein